jgi:hypothetical protein
METQIFHHAKNPLKETKILQDIITLELISSFQHKPKYHLSKILILIIDLLARGQNHLSYHTLQ